MFWKDRKEERQKQEEINLIVLNMEIQRLENILINDYWYEKKEIKNMYWEILWIELRKWNSFVYVWYWWISIDRLLQYCKDLQKEILLLQKYWCKQWKQS